jgi:hypothetical protein
MAKSKPVRSTDAVVYVYCSAADKKLLEDAAEKLVEAIPGAKMPVYSFVLEAALERARGVLGKK